MTTKTELGMDVEIKTLYPDLRDKHSLFLNLKTPVCGYKSKDCMKEGCNLHCWRQDGE